MLILSPFDQLSVNPADDRAPHLFQYDYQVEMPTLQNPKRQARHFCFHCYTRDRVSLADGLQSASENPRHLPVLNPALPLSNPDHCDDEPSKLRRLSLEAVTRILCDFQEM